MPQLTPYDTGARCEPRVWPTGRKTPEDDFGKVDFEDDCSAVVATVHLERTDAGYKVVIEPTGEPSEVSVEIRS